MTPARRVVVVLSGGGSNLQALIDATTSPAFPAEIVGVVSDQPEAFGLHRARDAQIADRCVPRSDFGSRAEFEAGLAQVIDSFEPDFVLLAGFMRILRGDVLTTYAGRMLNIHPSLLPLHKGLDTHQRAIDAGDAEHGCTVHYVTPELDGGPGIIQAALPIDANVDADQLAAQVLEMEHRIYPMALRWLAEGRIVAERNSVILDGRPLDGPVRVGRDELDP